MKASELETALMLMGFRRGAKGGKGSMFLFRGNRGYVRVELKRNMPLGRYQAEYRRDIAWPTYIGVWTRKSLLQAAGVLVDELKEELAP